MEEGSGRNDGHNRNVPDGFDSWANYWRAQGMAWRAEPEIDEGRQRCLAERRAVEPDMERGIYPFRDENGSIKLTRADVEWLLATHESGGMHGPVDWDDATQRKRMGLDLRGADISGGDLRSLPLSRLRGGLAGDELHGRTLEMLQNAAIRLTGANLRFAQLQGSVLTFAHLEGVDMASAHLEMADMYRAHFESTRPADIGRAVFDSGSILNHVVFANEAGVGPQLADVNWNGAILSAVEWAPVRMLGEEYIARYGDDHRPWKRSAGGYPAAVRANRQVSAELRDQGLHEEADKFAYRAHVLQRVVLRKQGRFLRYVGSLFLGLIAGYGYRPMRSLFAYALVVLAFAVGYFLMRENVTPALNPVDSIIFSVTSFHGRGFTPGENVSLHNPLTIASAAEAIIGLLIEITFIATFTQRFFAR